MTAETFKNICKNINLPECSAFDLLKSKFGARDGLLFDLRVSSPYSVIMLLISIFIGIRMVFHVNSLYASIGGKEMKIIYYLFIINNTLLLILVAFHNYINHSIYAALSGIQLSIASSMAFSIFMSGITIDRIYGIMKLSSSAFLLLMLIFYFALVFVYTLTSFVIQNTAGLLMIILFNFVFFAFYFFSQINKLLRIDSDVWAYGLLGIMLSLQIISLMLYFTLGKPIMYLCSKSLDGMFFLICINLIFMMMVHKYWSLVCDFEVECLTLEA